MTFREYLEENLEEIVAELCQYQDCENCSVRALFGGGNCPLWDLSPEQTLDLPVDL